jgi:hypothetical protein
VRDEGKRKNTNLEQAIGSSHDPGTDCTTMFDSLTPEASSFFFVPSSSGSMIAKPLLASFPHGSGSQVWRGKRTGIPTCMHDADAQGAAVEGGCLAGTFE